MFSTCSVINFLYAIIHNGDSYFIFCSAVGAIGNVTILLLLCLHKWPGLLRTAESEANSAKA